MSDFWSYDKIKRIDKSGKQWHFVSHSVHDKNLNYNETPFELYFRDDERTVYGVLRFEQCKNNPYRDWNTMINKIMNNSEFQNSLIDMKTKAVWNRNWK